MMNFFNNKTASIGSVLLLALFISCEDKAPQIIAPGADLVKVTDDYTFDTAGSPLWLNGSIYFTNNNFDQPGQSRTMKISSSGDPEAMASDNGVTTTLRSSGKGTIYACEMLGHRVVELDTTGQVIQVLADQYNGQRIDGPNDLTVDSKGGIYFSDSQFIAGGEKHQEIPAVYYIKPDKTVLRIIEDIEFPNGLALSPDGTELYVANTNGKHLLAYDVNEDGTVENERNIAQLELADESTISGADGIAVDDAGHIFVATTQGLGVQIYNKEGKHLENIPVPTPANNVSFGGEDHKTLYISAKDGIYSIKLK